MSGRHHEVVEADEIQPPSDRSTGLVFAVVAGLLAIVFRHQPLALAGCLAAATLLAAVSWLRPTLLHPLTIGWFRFGLLLNRVVSPLVMAVLYFGVVTPFGLVMQVRHDPLRRRRAGAESHWITRRQTDPAPSMRNQF